MKFINNKLLFFIYFITSLFIFYLLFGINSEVEKVNQLYTNIYDDYVYIENPNDSLIYKIENKKINTIKYEIKTIEIKNNSYKVIFMHEDAIKFGIPYYEKSYIKLPSNIKPGLYSNLLDNNFTYIDSLIIPDFNNKISNRNYLSDIYFCIDNNYKFNKPNYLIIDKKDCTSDIYDFQYADGYSDITYGKLIKDYWHNVYNNGLIFCYILSYVPYFIIIWLIFNYTFLIINSNYKFYKINQLFYMSKKKMTRFMIKSCLLCIESSIFLSSIIMEIVFKISFIYYLKYTLISLLVLIVITYIAIRLALTKFYKNKLNLEELR